MPKVPPPALDDAVTALGGSALAPTVPALSVPSVPSELAAGGAALVFVVLDFAAAGGAAGQEPSCEGRDLGGLAVGEGGELDASVIEAGGEVGDEAG